jgi:threonine 3-dehydrogenase
MLISITPSTPSRMPVRRSVSSDISSEETGSMRALVKAQAAPGLSLQEEPHPKIGAEDVLVRVRKTGICGTDIHIYTWDEWASRTIAVPMVVGHEFAGEIVEKGSAVRDLALGERVSGEGHVIGMKSRAARGGRFHHDPETRGIGVNIQGAFADYLKIPAFNIVPLPDDIDDEIGAILDPLGNAVHTALSFDLVGEDVLITGAGPIGIMSAAVARHVGARHVVVTDVSPARLALAAQVADVVPVDILKEDLASVMGRLGMREGFDIGLEMSGAPAAFEQMVDHLVMGGKIAMLGIPARPSQVDWAKIVFKMITIKGIYGREMFETWHKMLGLLQSGLDVRKVITHRFEVAEYERAFEIIKGGDSGKIILNWAS